MNIVRFRIKQAPINVLNVPTISFTVFLTIDATMYVLILISVCSLLTRMLEVAQSVNFVSPTQPGQSVIGRSQADCVAACNSL